MVESKNFFRGLTLNDIYGDSQTVHWVPHHDERQIILKLANIVAEGNKPIILEAACGNGFVSKLLAADGLAAVVGVDPALSGMGYSKLGKSPGEVKFEEVDFWDVVDRYSPQFRPEVENERRELLNKVRGDYLKYGPVYEQIYVLAQMGDPLRLNNEIARLQKLAELYIRPSSVSLVLCSFMPSGVDLTVPIRDGVYPKCIVYVRTPKGTVGAGDFYAEERNTLCDEKMKEEHTVSPYTAISLNPGVNYYTAAVWQTTYENDWSESRQELGNFLGAEVVVQLRNDVVLRPVQPVLLEKYTFDTQIELELKKRSRIERKYGGVKCTDFLTGISIASNCLFG